MNDRITGFKKAVSVLKFLLLIAIVVGIPVYLFFFNREIIREFRTFDDAVAFLREYQGYSAIVYIGLELLQIIVSILPGQIFQFAAGYLFGFVPGLLLSILGAALGTCITYFLAMFLGRDALKLFISEEKGDYYLKLFNSKKAFIITFILYLIPGFPKDTLGYVAGVSKMNFPAFLIISLIARMPAMAGSIVFGSMYMKKDYTGMIIVAAIVAVSLILIFLYRKKITEKIDSMYEKIS